GAGARSPARGDRPHVGGGGDHGGGKGRGGAVDAGGGGVRGACPGSQTRDELRSLISLAFSPEIVLPKSRPRSGGFAAVALFRPCAQPERGRPARSAQGKGRARRPRSGRGGFVSPDRRCSLPRPGTVWW